MEFYFFFFSNLEQIKNVIAKPIKITKRKADALLTNMIASLQEEENVPKDKSQKRKYKDVRKNTVAKVNH